MSLRSAPPRAGARAAGSREVGRGALRVAFALLIAAPGLALAGPARAQIAGGQPIPPPDRLVGAHVAPVEIAAGGSATARLEIAIAAGWHINANPPSPDYMIATVVRLTPAAGVSAGTPRYPAARRLKVAFDSSEGMVEDLKSGAIDAKVSQHAGVARARVARQAQLTIEDRKG